MVGPRGQGSQACASGVAPARAQIVRKPEPFAAVILCTSDPNKVDDRTRSKWSRVLRYAAEFKDLDELLADFIKCRGGVNKCAARFGTWCS